VRLQQACEHMGHELDAKAAAAALETVGDHPRWDNVAKRCLSCGNCTMVCPTCFCSYMVDSSDLTSQKAGRMRLWDSCHTHQFTYTTAGPHRAKTLSRYRHWMRHKLCTFQQQYNVPGCVGCGRCITWCPVGIDITEEAAAIINGKAQAKKESEVPS
jgi:sulfhydrogenase subunit beta (sulfur reductase)